jgi:hypothetical protein
VSKPHASEGGNFRQKFYDVGNLLIPAFIGHHPQNSADVVLDATLLIGTYE